MRSPDADSKGQTLDKASAASHCVSMSTVLTFGDSNTHGTPPIANLDTLGICDRYPKGTRWPTVMAAALGKEWDLVEDGLPGRTAQFDDPVMDGVMNGYPALRQALQSHGPLDVLTIMLGTNDTKARFSATPRRIAEGITRLLDLATGPEMQTRHAGFKVLLIAPSSVIEVGVLASEFIGANARSTALTPLLRAAAISKGAAFLDAGDVVSSSQIDGVHLTASAHKSLGLAVARVIRGF